MAMLYNDLIGKTLEEAEKMYPDNTVRVIKVDGKNIRVILNYVATRINVAIENDIITEFLKLG